MSLKTKKDGELSPNALVVLEKRYLKKDQKGKVIETPQKLFRRVAGNIAQADLNYGKPEDAKKSEEIFYEMISSLEFMPNSPTLMNAGRDLQQLSACFVLPVEDSMESIFEAIKNTALIHKSGGGTGFSFSRIRPRNDFVHSTHGISSGPLSFMTVFNVATETIKQGGTRRGANMGILRVDHPDILDFITAKESSAALNNFNISVAITDKFMQAFEKNEDYDLINPRDNEKVKKLSARKVFKLITTLSWKNGEPGIIFLDRLNKDNPTPALGEIESTNPCGEQPLLPYESCNLGSINLALMLKQKGDKYEIDFDKLKSTIHNAVHFLDNVIDMNKFPMQKIAEMTRGNRKIGLGVMGFADLLMLIEIPYNSDEAIKIAGQIMSFLQEEGRNASEELAKKRGPFPNIDKSIFNKKGMPKLRNATITTIAPTGTISMIAGCSSGIEPLFAVSYIRNVLDNKELLEVHPIFLNIAKKRGFYSDELMRKISMEGTIQNITEIPEDIRRVFVVSHDITPEWHIKMQAAFQKYTDNAVSKTVNFPEKAVVEEIEKAYSMAYKLGCKGVTIYRDKSRDAQVLNIGAVNKQKKEGDKVTPRERPQITYGATEKLKIGCGNLYITVNADEKGICEVFTSLGRAGGCPSQSEATSRLASLAFRSGIEVASIIEQLKGIRCLSTLRRTGTTVLSCPDAIGKAIDHFFKNGHKLNIEELQNGKGEETPTLIGKKCPDCGNLIEHEGGCVICRSCGYSKCG
ncbi:vitamin B12-dependent ribonucleotide reductase [Candidatus Desantisbacteria bacterium]|nr:vitamin B12-dependent ribonucleotide reductase [Candidatus Desantisbacteria bacterium]